MIHFEALDGPFFTLYDRLCPMEHPIPQNITSFEFHLVGDMTLKQFAYLATGLGTAYLIFATVFSVNQLVAIPLILTSALTGITFAFLPILDRPLDHWALSFVKAISRPTRGSWTVPGDKKKAEPNNPIFINRLQRYLQNLNSSPVIPPPSPPPPAPSAKTTSPTLLLKRYPTQATLVPPSAPQVQTPPAPGPVPAPQAVPSLPGPLPSSQELDQLVQMAKYAQFLQNKIIEAERQIKELHSLALNPQTRNLVSAQKLQQVSENLKSLVQQTEAISRQTASMHQQRAVPKPQPHLVVVENKPHQAAQLLLTSTPNVVNGIVTDAAGNYLESVIVIIHNKDGIPVRALKTNKLGQFTGATPLPSGTYTVTLEKENLDFETLQISLEGKVLTPLRISARRKEVLS